MPNLTLTIEDTSPLLVYSDNWVTGTARDDRVLELYSGGSYMSTQTNGANVFFTFNGTNVNLFGAKRQRNGFYQITVDSRAYTPVNGKADDPGTFQTALFSSITLPNAQHTVSLASADNGVVDLDFVSWTVPVGRSDEEIIVNTFQESDLSFKYSPSDAWSNNPTNLGTFSGGSGRITSKPGSTVEFTFEGDAISLFGPVGPTGAAYSVSINVGNGLPNNYSTNKLLYRPNMMLYHANSLGPGRHKVVLEVLPDDPSSQSQSSLAIDYAQVYTTPSLGGQRLTAGAPTSSASSGLSIGAVVGITAGGILGAIALVGIVIWGILCYHRQRHNRHFFYGFGDKPYTDESANSSPMAQNRPNSRDERRARPFPAYSEVNAESPPPPGSQPATAALPSQGSMYSAQTTPNTSQWPPTGGQNSSIDPLISHSSLHTPNQGPVTPSTQEIVVPPRGSTEKYRPDRIPQLQPPPQGPRSQPVQAPAALGAAWQSVSPVQEESRSGYTTSRSGTGVSRGMLRIDPNGSLEERGTLSGVPPPEYTQQPGPAPSASTGAGSFYVREAMRF